MGVSENAQQRGPSRSCTERNGRVRRYITSDRDFCNAGPSNDGLDDAAELLKISKWMPCKVNLIEYNPIENASYQNAEADKITAFHKFLADRGVQTNIRRSRGKDIDAACGQLAVKEEKAAE